MEIKNTQDLLNIGLTNSTIEKIIQAINSDKHTFLLENSFSEENIIKKCKLLAEKQCDISQINKIISRSPSLLTLSNHKIDNCYTLFIERGFDINQINKMFTMTPSIISHGNKKIDDTYDFFVNKGISTNGINKMLFKFPTIISYAIKTMDEKIEVLKSLGFNDGEVSTIIKSVPQILSYGTTKISDRYDFLLQQGLTVNQVNDLVRVYPTIFSGCEEALDNKFKLYRKINLFDQLFEKNCKNAKDLITCTELLYARWCHLNQKGSETTIKSLLHITNQRFERLHGISRDGLLKIYPINNFIKELDTNKRA
jgi:hypothetical protein